MISTTQQTSKIKFLSFEFHFHSGRSHSLAYFLPFRVIHLIADLVYQRSMRTVIADASHGEYLVFAIDLYVVRESDNYKSLVALLIFTELAYSLS